MGSHRYFSKHRGIVNWNAKSGPKVGDGEVVCEKNLRDVWCRNEGVRVEIGPILQTHTHTRVSFSSIDNVFLPQAANVTDRMPRKRVPQPARMSFSGYTIDCACTSWEPIGGICKPASWAEPGDPTTF